MKEIFGEFAHVSDKDPSFAVAVGSVVVFSSIYPWGENDATICTRAYVVTDVEVTLEFARYLLRENDSMRFGAFGLDDDDDVFFEHTIVGSSADKSELKASVMAVVVTADRYDDEIIARWGGQRAIDRTK